MRANRALAVTVALAPASLSVVAQRGGPPDSATVERFVLSGAPSIGLQPGDSFRFKVGTMECCVLFQPARVRVTWSVQPATGARIDRRSGLLQIDSATPAGSVFEVRADVERGRRVLTTRAYVYTPDSNPLVGSWHEVSELQCDGGDTVPPAAPIRELLFQADGRFSVTWIPFEVYRDYWGTYTRDPRAGRLSLVVVGGNYVPPDVHGEGVFTLVAPRRLVLQDVWLGSDKRRTTAPACGAVFER